MGAGAVIKDKIKQLQDLLMPIEYVDEFEEEFAEEQKSSQKKTASAAQERVESYEEEVKVANGGSYHVSRPKYTTGSYQSQEKSRPQLTVHTTKKMALKVQIYAPNNFDQVTAIADDLKAGKACVVNYEKIEAAEQRRICDFVNGVCYVLDGCAKRVTGQIVLYVPAGVDVAEAMTVAMPE